MIDAETICDLFPFSVQIDTNLNVELLGRSLAKRISKARGVPFEDLFDVKRLDGDFDAAWIRRRRGRPVLVIVRGLQLTLTGSFEIVDEGFLFLGGPRIETVDQLNPLGLSIDDFAAHDGIMSNLFLLQQMQMASDEALAAANKLATQERRYRQIVEQSNDVILITDTSGFVTLANPAAQTLLDVVPGDTTMVSLLQDESKARWNDTISKLRSDQPHSVELTLRGHGDTSVITEGHLVLRQSQDSQASVLAFLRDISARRKVEHDLARSNDHLRRAQKMQAIGRLAGGIAHDFNNLLAVVMGAGSMLKMDLPEGDPRCKDVDMILLSAEKGAALARQLLLFSRGEPTTGGTVELIEQTHDLMRILNRVVGSNVKVSFVSNMEPIHVAVDPGQYEQVIMNLVINARDAVSEGGTIQITICSENEGHQAIVQVADNGTGMTEEVAQSAFEPFFTTKDLQQGSGLGLSVVYGIISDAGGTIDLDTKLREGTTISLRIPTLLASADSLSATSSKATQKSGLLFEGKPEAILLEDQEDLRELTARGLEKMGFDVRSYGSLMEARAAFKETGTKSDLFVTDVRLGDGNGIDFAEEMAKEGLLSKVLVITAHANLARVDEMIIQFGWRLLMKPFSPHQLRLVVTKLMEESQ